MREREKVNDSKQGKGNRERTNIDLLIKLVCSYYNDEISGFALPLL
jgi:hypothetical protein